MPDQVVDLLRLGSHKVLERLQVVIESVNGVRVLGHVYTLLAAGSYCAMHPEFYCQSTISCTPQIESSVSTLTVGLCR